MYKIKFDPTEKFIYLMSDKIIYVFDVDNNVEVGEIEHEEKL